MHVCSSSKGDGWLPLGRRASLSERTAGNVTGLLAGEQEARDRQRPASTSPSTTTNSLHPLIGLTIPRIPSKEEMADPASNVEQRVDVKLARPYIEYGRISPAELQAFDESFSRTRTWVIVSRAGLFLWGLIAHSILTLNACSLQIATTVGAAMILPYGIWVRPKAGFFERMAVGGGLSIVGSSTAALMGVKSMRDELMCVRFDLPGGEEEPR